MNKGTIAPAPMAQPKEGSNKPAGNNGGKVYFGTTPPGRRGKK
jgi:hypothetical protein